MNLSIQILPESSGVLKFSDYEKGYVKDLGLVIRNSIKSTFKKINPFAHFPDIIHYAIGLSERFPPTDFEKWTDLTKKRAIEESLIFYRKYGHLGEGKYETRHLDIFTSTYKVEESISSFFEKIWYLEMYAKFLYRIKTSNIHLDSKYPITERDNLFRLSKFYAYNFCENVIPNDPSAITYPTIPNWQDMYFYYNPNLKAIFSSSYSIDNKLKIIHEGSSLFDAMILYILLDTSSDKNKKIKFCINCNQQFIEHDSRVKYCSPQCRSQYTSKVYREKKRRSKDG